MKRIVLLSLFVWLVAGTALAQRLPKLAAPESYTLTLAPNFDQESFTGDETIRIKVQKPTRDIILNAVDISFQNVTIAAGNQSQKATLSPQPATQMVTLTVPKPMKPGPASIHIRYTGTLNHELRGFYLGKEENGDKYAVTQFESTDARRAFPSFDEPAYKATFDITVIAPKDDTVISNGKLLTDKAGPNPGEHTVHFSTTPRMSSYLVAVAVGQFEDLEGSADGIPIRVWTTPGKTQLGHFALTAAEQCMRYYNNYFGIKYPYKKLDLIGLPDFAAGAMENTAAITFREVLLLVDEKRATEASEKEVAEVIAHEMAHQWFGDLVTMKWWDDVWLNEGFATWMESKPVAAWKPEWNIKLDDVSDTVEALNADSLASTRPVHQAASTPGQIEELFDAIAYGKAASVLRMIESYLGPEVFRDGINEYLKQHAYANATASDFWNALTLVSKKPVDRIMPSFIDQPGEPIVMLDAQCTAGKTTLKLQQRRYFQDRALFNAGSPEQWSIPICMRNSTQQNRAGEAQQCHLLSEKQKTLQLPGCAAWVIGNANGTGYYRTRYQTKDVLALTPVSEKELSPAERIMLISDVAANLRVGRQQIGDYMTLADGLRQDHNRAVMDQLTGQLQYIGEYLVNENDVPAYEEWVRQLLAPDARDLGWQIRPGDTAEQKELRARIFYILGYTGKDPQVLEEANRIAEQFLANPGSIDRTMAFPALQLAAMTGNASLYDKVLNQLKEAKTPEQYYLYQRTLSAFTDPALLQRTLQYALSPAVRSQDRNFLIAGVMRNPAGRHMAWNFVQSHWSDIGKQMGGFAAGGIVAATGSFCSADLRQQVQSFFTDHKLPAAERRLKQALETMKDCIDLKSQQAPQLATWLRHHATIAGE